MSITDICAGMYACTGILTSLLHRATTGEGDVLEVSMLEALGEWPSQPYFYAEHGGNPPPRSGAQHASIAPYGPFRVSDGTVFFGIQNDREWDTSCEFVMHTRSLAQDERLIGNANRVDYRPALHEVIDQSLGSLTAAEALDRLDQAGIANAQLRTMAEFSAHPQLGERNRRQNVESPVGPLRSLIPPVTARNAGFRMGGVSDIGEHTDAPLAEFGFGDVHPKPSDVPPDPARVVQIK